MEKSIQVTKEVRAKLAKTFNCTECMVYLALRYEKESKLARMIRHTARMMGGWMVVSNPGFETYFDDKGKIRQYFGNGAVVELSKTDGSGVVLFKGEQVKKYENVMLSDIEGIQRYAVGLK